jgi:hypothetical protein
MEHIVFVPVVNRASTAHGAGMTYGDCDAALALGLQWTHGWQRFPLICEGVEAVPQISRLREIGLPLGGNSRYVIFLNEPENPQQSNVPNPVDTGHGLAMAMATYSDRDFVLPTASEDYRDSMLDAAGDIDRGRLVANEHCYGWGSVETALAKCKAQIDSILTWAAENGITHVWVTEFGLDPAWHDGMDGSVQFMRVMSAYYDQAGVDRRAWFQVNSTEGRWSTGELGLWVGGLTELGEAYRELGEVL